MSEASAKLTVRLLGVPEIRVRGCPVHVRRRLVRAFVYYVAAHPEGVSRDKVAALFAPELPQRKARRRLTKLLWHARIALGRKDTFLHADADKVWLDPSCWVDVSHFSATLSSLLSQTEQDRWDATRAEELATTLALYRGEFLSGFGIPHYGELEQWILLERERLSRLFVDGIVWLTQVYIYLEKAPLAIAWAHRGLELDPLREDLQRALMLAYTRAGRRSDALFLYRQWTTTLKQELDLDPLPETRDFYQLLLREGYPSSTPMKLQPWEPMPSGGVPFVGREGALALLRRAWEIVKHGQGRIVFLRGEPGIGKTRLVQEFVLELQAPVWVGVGNPGMKDIPYHPLLDALRQHLHSMPRNICTLPPQQLSEISRVLPEILTLCPNIPRPSALQGEVGPFYLYQALVRLIVYLAHQPFVLFLDDVHWSTHELWTWFGVLLQHMRNIPLLVILTFRPEEAPPGLKMFERWAGYKGLSLQLTLEGLNEAEVDALIRAVCQKKGIHRLKISPRRLREHTGGNPYFILETVRWLVEHPQENERLPVPDRVRDVIRVRLDLLSPLAREILDAAAVLSPYMTVSTLARTAARSEQEAVKALEELLLYGFLLETGQGFPAYRFAHEQLREVTYMLISTPRRQILHRRAAQSLHALRPAGISNLESVLALHWELAGAAERALAALLAAMESAAQMFAYHQVVKLATRALALLETLPKTPQFLSARARVFLWRGRGYQALRDYRKASGDLEQAIRLAESLGLLTVLTEALAEAIPIAVDCWHKERAFALAERCVRAAQQCGDLRLQAQALYLREWAAVHFRHPVSEEALAKARRVFEADNAPSHLAEIWNVYGVAAFLNAEWHRALKAFDKALHWARMAHHIFLEHRIQTNRGHVLYNMGRFREAWEAFRVGASWLQAIDVKRYDNTFEVGRGYVALHLGYSQEAEEAFERAEVLADNMGSVLGKAYAHINLALLRGLQGRRKESEALLEPLLPLAEVLYPGTYVLLLERWGWLLRLRGAYREAFNVHMTALREARRVKLPPREAACLCHLGYDLVEMGRSAWAYGVFLLAREMARAGGERGLEAQALIGQVISAPSQLHLVDKVNEALDIAKATGSLLLWAEAMIAATWVCQTQGCTLDEVVEWDGIRRRVQMAGWREVESRLSRRSKPLGAVA